MERYDWQNNQSDKDQGGSWPQSNGHILGLRKR